MAKMNDQRVNDYTLNVSNQKAAMARPTPMDVAPVTEAYEDWCWGEGAEATPSKILSSLQSQFIALHLLWLNRSTGAAAIRSG